MIWKPARPPWSNPSSVKEKTQDRAQTHLDKARVVAQSLLEDKRLPSSARARLGEEYRQLERLLDKLEKGHIHVAAFGRVGVGKSALLNALAGREAFATSVLHGKTRHSERTLWKSIDTGGVYLIDTPGIDEVNGEERASIADAVVRQADVILFVVDGDMTEVEYDTLCALYQKTQPLIVVLNKVDRYNERERESLLSHLRRRLGDRIAAERVVTASARPDRQLQVEESDGGREYEHWVRPTSDVEALRQILWQLLCASGQSYAALNASVFAAQLSEKIGREIVAARARLAEKIIRQYALFKALGVAINPIPVVDLLALVADTGMVVHLSHVYAIALTRREASRLIRTVALQTSVLMGTVYGVQFLSSLLKGVTAGLSTVFTASAQAGVAFYGSYVVGKAAERYFAAGASWGEGGARRVVEEIMVDLDKDTLIREASASVRQILEKKHDK